MDYPNVLASDLKGQLANFGINIKHPLHMDAFMFTIKQRLESPNFVYSKL